jgi:hypothetical protein
MHQLKQGLALLLIAGAHESIWSTEVFRCGNSFGDLPCTKVSTSTDYTDARTRSQQTQSLQATQHDRLASQNLNDQRLKDEASSRDAQRLAGVVPPPPKPQAKTPGPAWPPRRRLGPPSPYFTARDADAAQQTKKK